MCIRVCVAVCHARRWTLDCEPQPLTTSCVHDQCTPHGHLSRHSTSTYIRASRTHASHTHASRTHASHTHASHTHASHTHASRTHASRTHACHAYACTMQDMRAPGTHTFIFTSGPTTTGLSRTECVFPAVCLSSCLSAISVYSATSPTVMLMHFYTDGHDDEIRQQRS